ncbi:MAG: nucleotide exchange factor GrpE [Neisseriaceae bacterium]|nr:nucleotide exchange factor GrpE [Neisseriaceae bacterium]MBP6862005.1 nucleotide exchange factor GrpE [Neisseriaceae bacterium]
MNEEDVKHNQNEEAAHAENEAEVNTEAVSIESLQARIAELEAQLQDSVLRGKADVENMRRRGQDEVQAANKYAIGKFAGELLAVKDSLEMALQDQSGQFDALKFGVDLTLKQLTAAFEKGQIQEINPLGEPLDPHKHQAMTTEESDEAPNTVLKVMQKGYMVADRVLRPALVVVAKAKEA